MKSSKAHYEDMLWYLAGPMSGIDKFNIPAFMQTKASMEAKGYIVHLPADLDDPQAVTDLLEADGQAYRDKTWSQYLADDIILIGDKCDGVAVMPKWYDSRGACLETFTAALCNKPIVYAQTMDTVSPIALMDAWSQWVYPQ